MKSSQKSLGLLGLSVGIGSILSLTPIDLVHAGTFSRDLMRDGDKIGHVEFAWNDDQVIGNAITDWRSLNSFSLTDENDKLLYDLDFFKTAMVRFFNYNLDTTDLLAEAYIFSRDRNESPTGQIGFSIRRMEDDLVSASRPVNANYSNPHTFNGDRSQSLTPIDNVILEATPPETNVSVPENNFVAALLMITGFVLIGSKKAF